MTTKKSTPTPTAAVSSLDFNAQRMLERSCERLFDDGDHIQCAAALYPLPSDGGWAPSVFLYVMIQPVGDADGIHWGQFVSPYQLTEELIDTYLTEFVETSKPARDRIRLLRAGGASERLGVATG